MKKILPIMENNQLKLYEVEIDLNNLNNYLQSLKNRYSELKNEKFFDQKLGYNEKPLIAESNENLKVWLYIRSNLKFFPISDRVVKIFGFKRKATSADVRMIYKRYPILYKSLTETFIDSSLIRLSRLKSYLYYFFNETELIKKELKPLFTRKEKKITDIELREIFDNVFSFIDFSSMKEIEISNNFLKSFAQEFSKSNEEMLDYLKNKELISIKKDVFSLMRK